MVLKKSFKKRVIVVGGGYAGVPAVRHLIKNLKKEADVEVMLIEPNEYQQTLSEFDLIAATSKRRNSEFCKISYRELFKNIPWGSLKIIKSKVKKIDKDKKTVTISSGETLEYWKLVIAVGAEPFLPPVEGLAKYAIPVWSIKNIEDFHDQITDALELAAHEKNSDIRKRLLSFTVIGGGDTGIEIIGTLGEKLPNLLEKFNLSSKELSLKLVEGQKEILPHLNSELRTKAENYMENELGIEILKGEFVSKIEKHAFYIGEKKYDSYATIWAGGVKAADSTSNFGLSTSKQGRIKGDKYLKSIDDNDIYVIGDNAEIPWEGHDMPYYMVAQFAVPQGVLTAKNIIRELRGEKLKPFKSQHKGEFISIGNYCVGYMFGKNLTGLPALFMKRLTYVEYWFMAAGLWFAIKRGLKMLRLFYTSK